MIGLPRFLNSPASSYTSSPSRFTSSTAASRYSDSAFRASSTRPKGHAESGRAARDWRRRRRRRRLRRWGRQRSALAAAPRTETAGFPRKFVAQPSDCCELARLVSSPRSTTLACQWMRSNRFRTSQNRNRKRRFVTRFRAVSAALVVSSQCPIICAYRMHFAVD